MTRHLTLIAALTSALALAACDTGNEETTADTKASAGTEQGKTETTTARQDADQQGDDAQDGVLDSAATLTLNGTLSAPDNISLPAQAEIHVQLIDVTLEDGSAKVLTQKTFNASEVALPLPFSLQMPSEALNDDHRQVLQAEIRDADDLVLWSTAEPEALAMSADNKPAPVALVLETVETAPNEEIEADEREVSQSDQEAKPAEEGAGSPEQA